MKQLWDKEGILLWPPTLVSFRNMFRFFLKLLKRHMFFRVSTIYLLEMPLCRCEADTHITARYITGIEPLLLFAREREAQDSQWHARSYVRELEERFQKGDRCLALEADAKIVTVIFMSEKTCLIKAIGYTLTIPEKTISLYDVYTAPAYRGRGLYGQLFSFCVNECARQQYERAWMWIMPHNLTSLKVHHTLGMNHIIRSISLCQIFGLRWHITKSLNTFIADI